MQVVGDLLLKTLLRIRSRPPASHLALFCRLFPHNVARDVRLYQVGRSHVPNPTEEVETTVSHRYQGVLAEENGLGPMGGLGELGKDDAGHAGVDEDTNDALEAHHHDGYRALGGGGSTTVPGSSLDGNNIIKRRKIIIALQVAILLGILTSMMMTIMMMLMI